MRAVALAVLLCACQRSPAELQPIERPREAARALVACAVDDGPVGSERDAQRRFEAALRREIVRDRLRFAVRAGRCESSLPVSLQRRSEAVRTLAEAWRALLPLIQQESLSEIALEQCIRRIGNAWRLASHTP
ncbi:MAG: hypothetical protein Q8Q09_27715 [Deltaproteobacteria bacterium]|nr:hypothetical protein [Deltaproteobacteria bacterium]